MKWERVGGQEQKTYQCCVYGLEPYTIKEIELSNATDSIWAAKYGDRAVDKIHYGTQWEAKLACLRHLWVLFDRISTAIYNSQEFSTGQKTVRGV